MSANPNSVKPETGEFRSRVPPSAPMTTKGHAPGLKIGKDAAPEFHAETHPPGSAPAESSFRPNPEHEIPGQALNPDASRPDTEGLGRTDPLDSLPTFTSKDVHNKTSYGKPLQGQTAKDRKDRKHGIPGPDRLGATMAGTGTAE